MITTFRLVELVEQHGTADVNQEKRAAWDHQASWRNAFLSQAIRAGGGRWKEWELLGELRHGITRSGEASHEFRRACKHSGEEATLILSITLGVPPTIRTVARDSLRAALMTDWEDDLYITVSTYQWTYVLTHEMPWIGPFFVRSIEECDPDEESLGRAPFRRR